MYRLFPFVMHEVVERLADGADECPFSLHMVRDVAYIVMFLQFADSLAVRFVVVGAVLTVEAWEDELVQVAARFHANFSSMPHVSSFVVEEDGRPVDCLRKDVCGAIPVIVKHVDYAALLDVILRSSQKTFVGLERSSLLDHLQWRSKSDYRMAFKNKLRKLTSVSIKSSEYWVH